VPASSWDGDVEAWYPRMLVGPGYTTRTVEAVTYAAAAVPVVRRLRASFPFDVIHAHFTYPDGVVAVALGRRYGVPVVISEHAPWLAWMRSRGVVRRQTLWAARHCAALAPVSQYVGATIAAVLGDESGTVEPVTPSVDGRVFGLAPAGSRRPGQLLFAGAVRHVKGVDVLVEALARLRRHRPDVRLVLVGDPFFRAYRRDCDVMLERARVLGVRDRIDVVGGQSQEAVARLMGESAVLVVPSRAESFSAVSIEALACGTPVVATRCGGPEEIVTPAVGCLVPIEDPTALAEGLAAVLDDPGRYDPAVLRRHALERYGTDVVEGRLATLYEHVLR
jgi:glycosyltransferase involved in cell wall biosynthesis